MVLEFSSLNDGDGDEHNSVGSLVTSEICSMPNAFVFGTISLDRVCLSINSLFFLFKQILIVDFNIQNNETKYIQLSRHC